MSGGVTGTHVGGETGWIADENARDLAILQRGVFVDHGSTAGTVRPSSSVPVKWFGTVAPTNAITNDEWYDRANEILKRYTGSAWVSAGSATFAPLGVTVTLAQFGGVPNNVLADCGAAWDLAMAYLASVGGGTLLMDPLGTEVWYTSRAERALTVAGHELGEQFAGLPIPNLDTSWGSGVIHIKWSRPARAPFYGSTQGPTGPRLVSTRTSAVMSGGKIPSVIGGKHLAPGAAAGFVFSSNMVVIENPNIVVPNNPSMTGIDLSGVGQVRIAGTGVLHPATDPTTGYTLCTNPHAFGVILPTINNNALVEVDSLDIYGFYGNLGYNEHANVKRLGSYYGVVARAPYAAFSHSAHFVEVSDEVCVYGIATVDPTTGVIDGTQQSYTVTEHWDIETAASGTFSRVSCHKDANNKHAHSGAFGRVVQGVGPTTAGLVSPTGSANLRNLDDINVMALGWVALTLGDGWSSYGADYAPPACRMGRGRQVTVRGVVTGGVAPGDGFTHFITQLPSWARPAYQEQFTGGSAVGANNSAVPIDVKTDGKIYTDGASNTYVSLSNIKFLAEQ